MTNSAEVERDGRGRDVNQLGRAGGVRHDIHCRLRFMDRPGCSTGEPWSKPRPRGLGLMESRTATSSRRAPLSSLNLRDRCTSRGTRSSPDHPPVEFGPVSAGDAVQATVEQVAAGQWSIVFDDTTSGFEDSIPVAYDGPGATAEWIEEAPTDASGTILPLANFGTADFADLAATAADPTTASPIEIEMVGSTDQVIAYPTNFQSDGLHVVFGAPSSTTSTTAGTSSSTSTTQGSTSTTRGQRARPRGQRAQPRRQRAQPRRQRAQPRRQRARPRRQRAQPRRQRAQPQAADTTTSTSSALRRRRPPRRRPRPLPRRHHPSRRSDCSARPGSTRRSCCRST